MRPMLVGCLLALLPCAEITEATSCFSAWTTGYVRTDHSPRTFDGTSIYGDEPIVAAGWSIPMGSTVWVEGLGTFRVADRGGGLAPTQIDIAVWSRQDAFRITGTRTVCVSPPE